MKKSIPVVATLAAIVIGTAATSTALASSASTATAGRNSKLSGALVIAWNQELLKIVQTPGAQPATVHQTRSYAMLHAAIDDAIGARILQLRANDGSAAVPPPFTPGIQPGNYRPTPPNFPTPVFTAWGKVTPFVLKNGSQFRPGAPPALTSAAYAQ